MPCKYLSNWKLPDFNFYPISMINISGEDQRSSVILVSSTEQTFSLVVADIDDAVRGNSTPSLFTNCGRNHTEPIIELKCAGSSGVVVTADGQLMAYDAVGNQLTTIDTYTEIKHVDQGPEKHQLFVVRQNEDVQTVLEVVDAADGLPASTTINSYEISAECVDSGAKFCIKSFTVSATNQRFLGDFLGFTKLSNGDQVTLLSIENRLYWLQPRDGVECDLIVVRCFASNVLGFEFSDSSICLTVLLAAGVLVVFSQSLNPDTLLVSRSSVYLQAPIEAYGFDKANNCFLYSNGLTTHRVRYHFSEDTNQLVTDIEEIPVSGVVAITLLECQALALLLTENNQFYALVCTDQNRKTSTEPSRMVMLRKDMRAASKRATKILTDEVEFDKRLETAIGYEQAHFDVLAVHRNSKVFGKLASVETSFHPEMPARTSNTVFVQQQGKQVPCLFASVKIAINLGFFELLVKQKRWSVCMEYDETVVLYPVHETFDTHGVFRATVFLGQSQLAHGLPSFRVSLFASVRNGEDNLLLTIPVPTSSPAQEDVTNLITKIQSMPTKSESFMEQAVYGIALQYGSYPRKCAERRTLTYCIQNEQSKTKAVSFSSALETDLRDTWSVLDVPVGVGWHGEKETLCLKSHHPGALDLIKRFLLQDDEYGAEMERNLGKIKGLWLELQAVCSTDHILQLYGRARSHGLSIDEM